MLPLDIVDVHLVGSNASFNYNPQSDLDVHIVVNFDLLDVDKEILTAAYNLQKAQFNRDYDISIHGVNIEMYIEDINSMTASNGIYSLYNKKWIKKPVKKSYPTLDQRFYDTLDRLADKMRKVVSSDDEVEITKNINMLYMMRKNGLATDGEFSIGNLLFKEIRNLGLLDQLKQRLKEVQSEKLTLEQMNESLSAMGILIKNNILEKCRDKFELRANYIEEPYTSNMGDSKCSRAIVINALTALLVKKEKFIDFILGAIQPNTKLGNIIPIDAANISHCWIKLPDGKIIESNSPGDGYTDIPLYELRIYGDSSREDICNKIEKWINEVMN